MPIHAVLAASLVVAARTVFRVAQDLMAVGARRHAHDGARRTLVYGAGPACTLFFREIAFGLGVDGERRIVVGVFDDDELLRGRYVHGYRVEGGIHQLVPKLAEGGADEVLVIGQPEPESMARLLGAAYDAGVPVRRWMTAIVPVAE